MEEKELAEIKKIEDRIENLTQKLMEKRPARFKFRDLLHDLFASFIVGFTIIFKGHLYKVAETMGFVHVGVAIFSTLLLLTAAIYFGSYINISDRKKRPFLPFWLKKITGHYVIAFAVSFYLIYLFGFNAIITGSTLGVLKVAISLAMPCSLGAAIPSLLKEY